jgi:hypothetical protein
VQKRSRWNASKSTDPVRTNAIAIKAMIEQRVDPFDDPKRRNEHAHDHGPVADRRKKRVFRRDFGRRHAGWLHTSTVLKPFDVAHLTFDVDGDGLGVRHRLPKV